MLRYGVNMGRRREHDEHTAGALLDAAERTIQERGVEGVSVRGLAEEVGTTTRAVYSLFGSKDGLLVTLGARAFEMLGAAVAELPETDDPAADLVRAGLVFREFATSHPILFRIGFKRHLLAAELASRLDAARLGALGELEARLRRLEKAGLGGRSIRDAACVFHALCEGMADMELRGALGQSREEQIWQDAFTALVAGFAAAPPAGRGATAKRSRAGSAR
jgi:AcrR family transcriptional regulator